MAGSRKKMYRRKQVLEIENSSSVDYIENLPNELLSRILSYFSFKEIDRLRRVNRKFKEACNSLLKIGYRSAKREVALCSERTRIKLRNSCVGRQKFKLTYYTDQIFWFVVNEFLSDSFYLFDAVKGYLNKKYSVNAKTLDVVHKLLLFKETDDAIPMVIEMIIGRSRYHSNMKCFEDYGVSYSRWFSDKKYRGRPIKRIRVPVFNKRQPGLDLPNFEVGTKKECYALVLDILTTLWRKKLNTKKHHLISKPYDGIIHPDFGILHDNVKMISALKPGQNPDSQLYVDSDTEDNVGGYGEEIFQDPNYCWNGYITNQSLDIMVSQGLPDAPMADNLEGYYM